MAAIKCEFEAKRCFQEVQVALVNDFVGNLENFQPATPQGMLLAEEAMSEMGHHLLWAQQ